MSPQDQELTALFKGLDTPGVSDALDRLEYQANAWGSRRSTTIAAPLSAPHSR
jgi:hypothetical protein